MWQNHVITHCIMHPDRSSSPAPLTFEALQPFCPSRGPLVARAVLICDGVRPRSRFTASQCMLIPHRQRQAHECDHDQLLLTAVSASSSSLPVSVEGSGPPEARILAASSTAQSLSGLSIVEIERPLPVSETCNSSHKQQKAPAHSTRQLAQPGWGETRRTGTEKVAHGSLGMDIMSTMACFEPTHRGKSGFPTRSTASHR
jgi:hypothetical protein